MTGLRVCTWTATNKLELVLAKVFHFATKDMIDVKFSFGNWTCVCHHRNSIDSQGKYTAELYRRVSLVDLYLLYIQDLFKLEIPRTTDGQTDIETGFVRSWPENEPVFGPLLNQTFASYLQKFRRRQQCKTSITVDVARPWKRRRL